MHLAEVPRVDFRPHGDGARHAVAFGVMPGQQAIRLQPANGGLALMLFRANRDAGVLLFAGWAFIAALI